MKNAIGLAALIAVLSLSSSYGGAKSKDVKQEAQEMSHDVKRGVNHAGRDVKDNTCELFHGKGECAVKKGVHSVKNGTDKIEDAVD
jgi:hypothetical protein